MYEIVVAQPASEVLKRLEYEEAKPLYNFVSSNYIKKERPKLHGSELITICRSAISGVLK